MNGGLLAALLLLPSGAEAACRQALALGLDISGSVDAVEYRLQRDGLAAALESPDVQAALFAPGAAPVRIAVYEWSGPNHQFLILPWTSLSDPAALFAATAALRGAPRPTADVTTATGAAMGFGFDLLATESACWTRTLDLSGDGPANTGPRPQDVVLPPDLPDVTVNGLVVANPGAMDALSDYFEAYVIRGPDAFVEPAYGFGDYAIAMERKLLRELQAIAIGVAQ
jgi:hypothetical protein